LKKEEGYLQIKQILLPFWSLFRRWFKKMPPEKIASSMDQAREDSKEWKLPNGWKR
jgi:hypothetical protein